MSPAQDDLIYFRANSEHWPFSALVLMDHLDRESLLKIFSRSKTGGFQSALFKTTEMIAYNAFRAVHDKLKAAG